MEELDKKEKAKDNANDNVEVARLFMQVMGSYKHSMIKIFEDTGFTGPQAMTMGILSKEKRIKMTDLSNKLCLSNSTVSGIVDRLEKQGMVERDRSKEDRRVVYVSICPKINDIHADFHKLIRENTENIIRKGTAEEIDKIVEGLNILKNLFIEK
ncbi:MarR family winged helix-turn-helix transcriptional regulator [Clostridium sp.]|jgi:DNA-binding MarR family transcriptional regulator|uniref:MarR family winged helix-turn-helix transcriptional regulator n=1 Tax=Clostridium sp. TaxID=1506 RepID=UPI003EED7E84